MIQLKTLAAVAAVGLLTTACQTDEMAYTGDESNAAAVTSLGSDATGFKPVEQIPGNSSYVNQPGIPGESLTNTRSPGARENSTVTP